MASRHYALFGAGKRWFLEFDAELTLGQNLEAKRESIEAGGILPRGFAVSEIRVAYDDRVLNPEISIEEQCPGIGEDAELSVEIVPSSVALHVQYQPDHSPLRSREFQVDLQDSLDSQLREFLEEVHTRHKFRGLRRKRFRVRTDGRSLKTDRSLSSYGIESTTRGTLVPAPPWGWFGIPFRALEWTLTLTLLSALAVLVWWLIPTKPQEIEVAFSSEVDCHVRITGLATGIDSVVTIATDDVEPHTARVILPRGLYELEYFPKGKPIHAEVLEVDPPSDQSSIAHEITLSEPGSTLTLEVEAFVDRPGDADWQREVVESDLLVNGWPADNTSIRDQEAFTENLPVGIVTLPKLPVGRYEIRHDVGGEFDFGGGTAPRAYDDRLEILRPSRFEWDFSQLGSGTARPVRIVYWYREAKGP